ncbi:hypothetical protein [Actinophytocola sp. NPDC049390]|uniref:hypothetical protein n=1 Tax=Actinophytocola sp. NPDC049390 TaxID=3363894 RepID=UPI0037911168
MCKSKIIAVVLGTTALLGVSACGSDEPRDSATQERAGQQETATEDTSAADAENKAQNADELAEDVEIVTCGEGDAIGVSATVEVTNSLDEPMEYIGTIKFLDASGAELTDGIFNTGTLEPGQIGTEEVPGANVYEKVAKYTCELVEVKIDEPV